MKKHIKKQFLNEVQITPELEKLLPSDDGQISDNLINKARIPKEYVAFLKTDNSIFQAFQFKYKGQTKLVPEPDPVLVYFHTAYVNYKQLIEKQMEIFNELDKPVMGEPQINQWYDYFGLTTSCATFLFTTLEAFANRLIPSGYEYKKETKKSTELFNKDQIEEYFSFYDKIKTVVPDITKKDFFRTHPPSATHIENLKEFRDSIMHTKMNKGTTTYDELFKKSLKFKFKETLEAVAKYCNFYHSTGDYIRECDCNQDW